MARLTDDVRIEVSTVSGKYGVLDNFTSFSITNDITAPSEAAFEIGDDGTWSSIKDYINPGTEYKVFVNGYLRLTGRVEMDDIPMDAGSGAVVRFTIRTKLADAMFASARAKTNVKNTTLLEFIKSLYKPLGFTESYITFPDDAYKSRDLMTGKNTSGQGKQSNTPNLEKINQKEAKVQPPETIYDAADRHLRRHGLMHWDNPKGGIVVSAPNDEQDPIYYLRSFTGAKGVENNIISSIRIIDYSETPSVVGVFGVGSRRGFSKAKVSALFKDTDVKGAGFYRPIVIIAEGIKTQALADRAALRELAARSKRKDAWEIKLDGLSWWDGRKIIPFGVDTVADVTSNLAGGTTGAYYIYKVVYTRNASEGDTTTLSMTKRGNWRI